MENNTNYTKTKHFKTIATKLRQENLEWKQTETKLNEKLNIKMEKKDYISSDINDVKLFDLSLNIQFCQI